MKSITNAYLRLERYATAAWVVYERSKCGDMKELNMLDFKCLGFFLQTPNLMFSSSVGLFSRLLVSWFIHFSVYHIHCIMLAKNSGEMNGE